MCIGIPMQVRTVLEGHVLAEAALYGTYSLNPGMGD